MIYTDFEEAKKADPQKKGVGLYEVRAAGENGDTLCRSTWRYIWARSANDALAEEAKRHRWTAVRIRVGVDTGTFNPEDLNGE